MFTREEVVVATKVHGETMPGPNGRGLSRKHIMDSIDASLERLDMDFVDLYQIHRWDSSTPMEEAMEADPCTADVVSLAFAGLGRPDRTQRG
jgi:aryl-alcohol dehydrogenase-like predicted oxidoreductase